jgi:hypothetical protein
MKASLGNHHQVFCSRINMYMRKVAVNAAHMEVKNALSRRETSMPM